MNHLILITLSVALYIGCGALLAVRLGRGDTSRTTRNATLTLGAGAVVLHGGLLYQTLVSAHGINLGFFNAGSLVSWLIALILLLTAIRKPVENLGIVLFPVAAIAIVVDGSFTSRHIIHATGHWQLDAHILISFIAYSLLTIAMVQAVLLAIQEHHLRNRQPGGFIRALPPLQTMESLLFQMIAIGFSLLTVGLLIGLLFLHNIFAQHLVHKTVLSLIGWFVFAILLWGRWRYGWRGRIAIRWTLGGFITLMLAYFGSKMVLELILHR
ncbi:MAG: cytochrome c biogenesis protein CcsA [Gammaproteobacteria bacterium]